VKVTEFAFSLHGTSALVESVFPFMNSVWSLDGSRMDDSAIWALLYCKLNFSFICKELMTIKVNTKKLKCIYSRKKSVHWLSSRRKSNEICYWVEKCKWLSDIRTTIWYLILWSPLVTMHPTCFNN
jgi:hypothetical protein